MARHEGLWCKFRETSSMDASTSARTISAVVVALPVQIFKSIS
jgi:hypothetical protein